MTDQANELRTLIHQVRTMRRQFCAALDGIEARLGAMVGPEESFQVPDNWSEFLCASNTSTKTDVDNG